MKVSFFVICTLFSSYKEFQLYFQDNRISILPFHWWLFNFIHLKMFWLFIIIDTSQCIIGTRYTKVDLSIMNKTSLLNYTSWEEMARRIEGRNQYWISMLLQVKLILFPIFNLYYEINSLFNFIFVSKQTLSVHNCSGHTNLNLYHHSFNYSQYFGIAVI